MRIRAALGLALVVSTAACAGTPTPTVTPSVGITTALMTETATPAPSPTGPSAAVLGARTALGEPAVAIVEDLAGLVADVDAVRHEVARGQPLVDALALLDQVLADLAADTEALRVAAAARAASGDRAVRRAAAAATTLADTATAALAAASEERAALGAHAAFDVHLAALVDGWDTPGSQSQRRAALEALTAEVQAATAVAAALPNTPGPCTALRDNRVRWTALVAERTAALSELATSASGSEYDTLRDRFRRAPYGEDPAVADAADRTCWEDASALPAAARAARDQLTTLERALV